MHFFYFLLLSILRCVVIGYKTTKPLLASRCRGREAGGSGDKVLSLDSSMLLRECQSECSLDRPWRFQRFGRWWPRQQNAVRSAIQAITSGSFVHHFHVPAANIGVVLCTSLAVSSLAFSASLRQKYLCLRHGPLETITSRNFATSRLVTARAWRGRSARRARRKKIADGASCRDLRPLNGRHVDAGVGHRSVYRMPCTHSLLSQSGAVGRT